MKISGTTSSYINQTYANQAGTAANQNQKTPLSADEAPTDSINLSGKTKDIQKIVQSMDSNAAERKNYVAQIKEQVENDQYNVNAEVVAQKMLGGIIDGTE